MTMHFINTLRIVKSNFHFHFSKSLVFRNEKYDLLLISKYVNYYVFQICIDLMVFEIYTSF